MNNEAARPRSSSCLKSFCPADPTSEEHRHQQLHKEFLASARSLRLTIDETPVSSAASAFWQILQELGASQGTRALRICTVRGRAKSLRESLAGLAAELGPGCEAHRIVPLAGLVEVELSTTAGTVVTRRSFSADSIVTATPQTMSNTGVKGEEDDMAAESGWDFVQDKEIFQRYMITKRVECPVTWTLSTTHHLYEREYVDRWVQQCRPSDDFPAISLMHTGEVDACPGPNGGARVLPYEGTPDEIYQEKNAAIGDEGDDDTARGSNARFSLFDDQLMHNMTSGDGVLSDAVLRAIPDYRKRNMPRIKQDRSAGHPKSTSNGFLKSIFNSLLDV